MAESKSALFSKYKVIVLSTMISLIAASCKSQDDPSPVPNHEPTRLSVPAIFSDGMILQRGKPLVFWGKCKPISKVVVQLGEQKASAASDEKGNWQTQLPAMKAGGSYLLKMTDEVGSTISCKDVMLGDVWLCAGQSNMNFILAADSKGPTEIASLNNVNIREYRCKMPDGVQNPENSEHSKWIPAKRERANKFSAVAYYFAKKVQETVNVPIGIVVMSCGNTRAESWMSAEAIKNEPALNSLNGYISAHKGDNTIPFNHRPAEFYNLITKPLSRFGIKGVLWYQGESNALPDNSGRTISERVAEYKYLLTNLINNWRSDRNESMLPFYIVQLPNYKDPSGDIKWAEIRQAQLETVKEIPNTGLAVTIDLGDSTNLHPNNKSLIGERLARLALNNEYGENIVKSGPIVKQLTVNGTNALLSFDFTNGGLQSKSGQWLKGFAIADASAPNVFVAAKAYIQNDNVVVSNPLVSKPVAVRYAWGDNPPVSLYNQEDLPASPFIIK